MSKVRLGKDKKNKNKRKPIRLDFQVRIEILYTWQIPNRALLATFFPKWSESSGIYRLSGIYYRVFLSMLPCSSTPNSNEWVFISLLQSLKSWTTDSFIWIRCVGARTHRKHKRLCALRTSLGNIALQIQRGNPPNSILIVDLADSITSDK